MTSGFIPAVCICLNTSFAACHCPSLPYAVMRALYVMTLGFIPAARICSNASFAARHCP
jgi:hypothetical protein